MKTRRNRIDENQKVTLTLGQLMRLVKESRLDSDYVGAQKFTYAELRDAWKKLKANVENDPEYDPEFDKREGIVYDVRAYRVQWEGIEDDDFKKYGHHDYEWFRDDISALLSDEGFDELVEDLESRPNTIAYADLEVYWNNEKDQDADTTGQGITIENGRITKVY